MVKSTYQNPKLIAQNGIYLFIRLLFVLFLSFYITRLALAYLGEEDFGINDIVGGITAIFAIVSMPITNTIQRFFNVEFTKNEYEDSIVFATCKRMISILVVVLIILYETAGLYFINFILNIPEGKIDIANIVFQLSAITNIFNLLSLPYQSLLYAKENMKIYAYGEIGLAIFRLISLIILPYLSTNHLISYSSILLVGYLFIWGFYKMFVKIIYPSVVSKAKPNNAFLNKVMGFSGWNFLESVSGITTTYGTNILINIFGGVLYNTAYGISKQISNAINSFTINIMKAVEPQITSSDAQKNYQYRDNLVIKSAILSFLIIGYIYIIFYYSGNFILKIWLSNIPLYTMEIISYTLLYCVTTSIILPFRCLILATGEIKEYFSYLLILTIITILVMYYLLKKGMPVIFAFAILVGFGILKAMLSLFILKIKVQFTLRKFIRSLFLSLIVLIALFFINKILVCNNSVLTLVTTVIVDGLALIITGLLIIFSKTERKVLANKINLWKKR